MKKLFGTDGIRAIAGQPPLDDRTIHAVGLALAHHLGTSPRLLIGMDTRESSEHIAAALTAGLTQGGATVESAGVITTPAVAALTRAKGFSAGVVISASHNPWQDNGIKLFGPDGYKLPDATELAIEDEIFRQLASNTQLPPAVSAPAPTPNEADRAAYIQSLLAAVPTLALDGRRIVLDCANGAASAIAPQLFAELNARGGGEVILTHSSPDGRNINERCGALHPEIVAQAVLAQHADLGITFDGDADRVLFADHTGKVVNGDAVLLLAARDLHARGLLANATVVATTMSNMGLESALKRSGIQMLRAAVGDKYVLEQMQATGTSLGGEQSGHILFAGRSTTGDGLLTALLVLDILHRANLARPTGSPAITLADLTADLKTFPQVIVNVRVREKRPLEAIASVAAAIAAAEQAFGIVPAQAAPQTPAVHTNPEPPTGRVVIRYSGTEALARVMIEAESESLMRYHADQIAKAIQSELGL